MTTSCQLPRGVVCETSNLQALPVELVYRIFTHILARQADLKAARLTCRFLADVATRYLFYRIGLSRLKTDRDAFLSITARPHLARHVHVLAWAELAQDEASFIHLHNPRSVPSPEDMPVGYPAEDEDLYTQLIAQALDLFWLPMPNMTSEEAAESSMEAYSEALREFRPLLFAAFEALPALRTVISHPMPSDRVLTNSTDPAEHYPLTAQLLQRGSGPRPGLMNEGFFGVLCPAIAHRATESSLQSITRLSLADEGGYSSMVRVLPWVLPVFEPLTHVDLCLTHIGGLDLFGITKCLQQARGLLEMRLCFDRGRSTFVEPPDPDTAAEPDPEGREVTRGVFDTMCVEYSFWPNLRSLHLGDIWFTEKTLLTFVEKHAASLRRLRFDGCSLTAGMLSKMALVQGLSLDEFIAIAHVEEPPIWTCPGERVTAFVNSRGEADRQMREALDQNSLSWLQTGEPIYDCCSSLVGAISDTRSSWRRNKAHGYSEAEIQYLDALNGEERDGGGCAVLASPTGGSSYDDSGDGKEEEEEEEEDNDEETSRLVLEQASYEKMVREAPRWLWQRCKETNKVYYWKAGPDDIHHGVHTKAWRFTHRNGETALGDDPLEFWTDWEGSEAGDVAEPTPHCGKFDSFCEGIPFSWAPDTPIPFDRATLFGGEVRKRDRSRIDLPSWEGDSRAESPPSPLAEGAGEAAGPSSSLGVAGLWGYNQYT